MMHRQSDPASPNQISYLGRLVMITALIAALCLTGASAATGAQAPPAPPPGTSQPDLGPNVRIFDTTMKTSYIQGVVDAIRDKQVTNEMGTDRYSLLFKPGIYGSAAEPLIIQVGYYTEVAGLGQSTGDVTFAFTFTQDVGTSAKSYTLTDFGNNGSAVVADPAGGANQVAMVSKELLAPATAGTTVSTGANLSVDTIPFTAAATRMTMRVFSPAAGIRVRMKVENAANPGQNCETDAFTTLAGAWETLTFDFGDTSTHYIPDGPTSYDLTKPTQSLNTASTFNKVSVFFDYFVGVGGYAPMPAARTYYIDDLAGVS